jgi:dTDP-L-rhamnose 4-epimerase
LLFALKYDNVLNRKLIIINEFQAEILSLQHTKMGSDVFWLFKRCVIRGILMENILIIGGAGFIGSHLADRLIDMNHNVTVFDSLEPVVHPDGRPPAYLNPKIHLIKGDVCNFSHLKRVIKDKTVIVNMAAHVVDRSNEIKRYLDTNVGGTANLMECLLNSENCCRKLIHASILHRSTRKLFAYHPFYYISKKVQEENIYNFSRLFKFPVVILRYAEVYGIRQSLSVGLGPIVMRILEQKFEKLFLKKESYSIDFISVHDAVSATVKTIFDSVANGKTYEVGTAQPKHLHDVTCMFLQHVKKKLPTLYVPEQSQCYAPSFICKADIELLQHDLQFQPSDTLSVDIPKLVNWLFSPEGIDIIQTAKQNQKITRRC